MKWPDVGAYRRVACDGSPVEAGATLIVYFCCYADAVGRTDLRVVRLKIDQVNR